jgi:hypothetical protein
MSVPSVSPLRMSSQTTFSPWIAGESWSNSLGRSRSAHPDKGKIVVAAAIRSKLLRAIGFIPVAPQVPRLRRRGAEG